MKLAKTASVEELQILGQFEGLKKILLSEAYADHLDKPLAYWALPTDRRLPLAFLGRSLSDLLRTPLAQLTATPGIGRKKMASFVQLLARAANTDPTELPAEILHASAVHTTDGDGNASGSRNFDPTNITEITWAQWRASVVKHGLTGELLGRLAPSLRNMTRVIWNVPLGAYVNSTLAEIRSMRTHGEKRVHAVLEVFHAVDAIVAGMQKQDHLAVRIMPRLIDMVETWIGRTLQRPGIPTEQEIFGNFICPLLEQIRIDATQQIVALAENRLGIGCPITSVRQAARTMGLTRARVYQLLNEINDIMAVRWPTGRHQAHELRERLHADAAEMSHPPDLSQLDAAVELFYPGNRRGAAGPLEQAAELIEQEDELLGVS